MTETTEIALLGWPVTPALYQEEGGIDRALNEIAARVSAFVPDVTTAAGRAEVTSFAYKITRSKTALDDAGKALVEEAKRQVGVVDAARKRVRDTLDGYRDQVKAPLAAWEEAERQRVAALEQKLAALKMVDTHGLSAHEIGQHRDIVKRAVIDASWDEYYDLARAQQAETVNLLTERYEAAAKAEADAAELAELRRQAAEKLEAEQKAERARVAAEQKAERDKAAAEALAAAEEKARLRAKEEEAEKVAQAEARARAAERQAKEAAAQAERAAAQAVEQEKQRAAMVAQRQAAEDERKLAQKRQRAKIKAAILEALMPVVMTGNPDEIAEAILTGKIPHVKVVL